MPEPTTETLTAEVAVLKQQLADEQAKVKQLDKDNYKQRGEIRDLKAASTLPEGSVVLSAADAAVWKSYQELGKPEELKAKIAAGEKAVTDLASRDQEKSLDDAAEAMGWNAKALKKMPGADRLKIEIVKEKVDDDETKVVYVTDTATQGATRRKLTEHADAEWSELAGALTADAADASERKAGDTQQTFPAQRPAKTGGGAKRTDEDFRKATEQTAKYDVL